MQFFLTEIVARIVAIYLFIDCSRKLWRGLIGRKIAYFNPDLLDWWAYRDVHRETAPIRYWVEIGIRITLVVACLFVAIFGWWQTNT